MTESGSNGILSPYQKNTDVVEVARIKSSMPDVAGTVEGMRKGERRRMHICKCSSGHRSNRSMTVIERWGAIQDCK